MTLTRRDLLVRGAVAAAAAPFLITELGAAPPPDPRYAAAFRAIDAMIERYMREMSSPGLALAIADRDGVIRAATYGMSDPDRKEPVRPEHLFHIGSITKSFTAIALLQLRDAGKIDFHAPVTRYLPWLRIEPREVITTHHLLTHSSGLPSWAPVFLSDPDARHQAGFTSGAHFHYCNLGYAILGHLIETLDGRPYPEAIRARIFQPLGMSASTAYIAPELRERTVNSHIAYRDDRPHRRHGRVTTAPQIIFDNAAGSISSNAADMALYLRMLANAGKPLLSETAYADLVKPYVPTEAGGKESYAYGLFTTTLDEHPIVRHTGGMVSFMSAMHVDTVDGIGVFASVNAQQGYRPNPVSIYALRAIRAAKANQPMPELPPPNPPTKIADAAALAGVYTSSEGDKIEFVVQGESLFLMRGGKQFEVEIAGGSPYVAHPEFDLFSFVFDREKKTVAHGARLWFGSGYSGERTFTHPEAWRAFVGHYRNEDPWVGSLRVVMRQGKLWLNGTTPLRQVDATTFRLADSEHNPEWLQFLAVVNGRAQHVKLSGYDLWRVAVT